MFGWRKKDRLNEFERKLLGNVERHGCHINMVFDPEGDEPGFAYSAGFEATVKQPEVIIFGLDGGLMGSMINETLNQCRAGLVLEDGAPISGLLDGFDCVARAVRPECIIADYFNSAMWHHEHLTGRPLQRAVQIVWPGNEDGIFPWQAGADPSVRNAQPDLYEKSLN